MGLQFQENQGQMQTRPLRVPLGRLLNCKMGKCRETRSIPGIFVWLRNRYPFLQADAALSSWVHACRVEHPLHSYFYPALLPPYCGELLGSGSFPASLTHPLLRGHSALDLLPSFLFPEQVKPSLAYGLCTCCSLYLECFQVKIANWCGVGRSWQVDTLFGWQNVF